MIAKICFLTALAACIGLLLTGFAAGQVESSLTLYSSGVVQQTPTVTYSYIISVSGTNYQMTNGTTGQIDYQSTNSSQVFSNVVGNCSTGGTIDVAIGVYTVNTTWLITGINGITLNFENGAKLVAGNGLDTNILWLDRCDNWVIDGITVDGNSAENSEDSNGIWITGDNNVINNALVFDCRRVGIEVNGVGNGIINSKSYNCGWNGITASDLCIDSYVVNNEVYGCSDVGIATYGVGTLIAGNYIHDMNGTTGDGHSTRVGITVEGGCDAIITQNTIHNCSVGVWVGGFDNCTISNNVITGGSVASAQYGIYLDTSTQYTSVTDNHVTGMYCNTTAHLGGIGIFLSEGSTFNTISGNIVSQCGSGGIFLDSTSNNNTVVLNYAFDTQTGRYYAMEVGGSGIEIAGSSNYISQNQAFDDRSGSARTQQFGIAMDNGAYNNTLIGNYVYNNYSPWTNWQIFDHNVPENTMINNIGYNPVGYIANPISGNTAYLVDSGSNSTWISGRVYTNTGSPKVLNISAGTVSAVAQNGVTLFTTTGCTVTLQPGDTFSITFSTAPTINVIGQ